MKRIGLFACLVAAALLGGVATYDLRNPSVAEAGWATSGGVNLSAYSGSASITGASGSTGLTITASGVNATALSAVGVGTGAAAYFKGGSGNGAGVTIESQGGASHTGLSVTNGGSGWAVFSSATAGRGVYGTASTGTGVYAGCTGAGTALTAINTNTGLAAIFTSDTTAPSQGTIRLTPVNADPTACTVGDVVMCDGSAGCGSAVKLRCCTATNTWGDCN